ncbi:UBC-like protein [Aspergillus brunneoviolaceus CBS 621.78]|uniref:UBC-like protein n=1 Tax=Aspergillus brunneoviolaceus CBS 621.78 TaxID=1450534 RepID=A0ACD1GDV7_9EURO|nr:UBC-like protein [Aspergillus brunneoviolaceus CBS 621.78]RAH47358.1 UBC-like protein [Aspergillus brunneoviolaceus CBS 621.78]
MTESLRSQSCFFVPGPADQRGNVITTPRRRWRKKPLFVYYARPSRNRQGVRYMMKWEGGLFKMLMIFPEDQLTFYPSKPPECQFSPPLFHPNDFPRETVCLSILDPKESWSEILSVKEILLGVQELLDNPNPDSPAQSKPYHILKKDPARYRKKIRKVVKENPFNRD